MKTRLFYLIVVLISIGCSSDSGDSNNDDNFDNEQAGNPNGLLTATFEPCENGMAGIYPCDGYDLLAQISINTFGATLGNDIWGWTDTSTGKEYAIMGLDNGTAFIDISDMESLKYLGKLPTATVASPWRDIKVYQNHAFIVAEASDHGMQVFDLTRLKDVQTPQNFTADTRYTGFGNAHNIVINEESGFAYVVGTARDDAFRGGAHFINIQNPKSPTASGGYSENGYSHDAQVVTYNGPDSDYTGREIYIGANENQVIIADVTDKDNPSEIATVLYPNIEYTHQGWFTEDQRFFLLGDELDEQRRGFRSRTLIFDFTDLDAPQLHDTYLGTTSAIDHNGYVKGNEFFLANYRAGVRVLDISGIEEKSITEKAFFDTFPSNDTADFSGVWSVYPYFESEKIIVSDINGGLFIIRKSE
ncbi:choice-of-anchor B family protein [Costertonia aggregata]|uniref:Choice-of-anchor B family protein n=1 Tax=Costertonia aggregata TaxID=343403 RepID=A0A7H9APJ7_9FLAO|nr:choice-of-anchor B family protein [Costertonia aggregata]QLG45350.1 choice-of-anchor B family protein [Costertonia aggregata]